MGSSSQEGAERLWTCNCQLRKSEQKWHFLCQTSKIIEGEGKLCALAGCKTTSKLRSTLGSYNTLILWHCVVLYCTIPT